jgi:hypothetical protein
MMLDMFFGSIVVIVVVLIININLIYKKRKKKHTEGLEMQRLATLSPQAVVMVVRRVWKEMSHCVMFVIR